MGLFRLILALTVVIGHSGSPFLFGHRFTGGMVAVQAFFIISGFYMALILNKKYVGKDSYKLFISNRFLRLFPAYWVVLLMTVGYLLWSGNHFFLLQYYESLDLYSFLFLTFTNLIILGQDLTVFLGLNISTGTLYFVDNFHTTTPPVWKFLLIPQAWSLGVELMFYIIAPFLVRKSIYLILLILIVSLMLRVYIYLGMGWQRDPWTYRFFPTELALFMSGVISYKFYSLCRRYHLYDREILTSKIFLFIMWILLLAATLFFEFISISGHSKFWLYYFLVVITTPYVFILTKNSKIDSYLGDLSYPIYISHILVISVVKPILQEMQLLSYVALIASICSICISVLLIKLIINPIERYRQQRIKLGGKIKLKCSDVRIS